MNWFIIGNEHATFGSEAEYQAKPIDLGSKTGHT